ncbi:MAG: hypothetical protein JNM84_14780 [Planctomycetes bacterium]|nr:hypothetical protein [Planctomycetota bacterium]
MSRPPLPIPERPARSTRSNALLLLWSLTGGLLLASGFLVVKRWLDGEGDREPEGYFPIAAEEAPEAPELASGTSLERARAFERLLEDARRSSIDLDGHFAQDVLPLYDEAARYTEWLLGFAQRAKSTPGVADSRAAEDERKD